MKHLRLMNIVLAGLVATLSMACSNDSYEIPKGSDSVPQEGSEVEITKNSEGQWQLVVNKASYEVKGAAANHFYADVSNFGGNTIRLYSAKGDGVKDIMDDAFKSGLMVYLGLNMSAATTFDYSDAENVKKQKGNILTYVNKFKDHPALLCWSLGNEIEASNDDNVNMWKAVGDLAKEIKAIDPKHPITCALAGSGTERLVNLCKYAPDIDFISVNSYYPSVGNIPDNLKSAGIDLPYMVTEFGPRGTWSMASESSRILPWSDNYSTSSKALVEETSTEKEAIYEKIWNEDIVANRNKGCLGGFIFVWGYQTHGEVLNWYGTHTKNRYAFGCCDAMEKCWTGDFPKNQAPRIESRSDMTMNGKVAEDAIRVTPGSSNDAKVAASSPSGVNLTYHWFIFKEGDKDADGGIPNGIDGLIEKDNLPAIKFKAPDEKGAYRLYVYALDDVNKKAASACIPFYVE